MLSSHVSVFGFDGISFTQNNVNPLVLIRCSSRLLAHTGIGQQPRLVQVSRTSVLYSDTEVSIRIFPTTETVTELYLFYKFFAAANGDFISSDERLCSFITHKFPNEAPRYEDVIYVRCLFHNLCLEKFSNLIHRFSHSRCLTNL